MSDSARSFAIPRVSHLLDDAETILSLHAAAMRARPGGEDGARLALRLMIHAGNRFSRQWGIPHVSRYRLEVPVPGGRIDLVLFHYDQSVSLVEVKSASVSRRDVLAGIGQLCYYAAMAPEALRLHSGAEVRRILCAPLEPGEMVALGRACGLAGVILRNLPPPDVLRQEMQSYRQDMQRMAEHP